MFDAFIQLVRDSFVGCRWGRCVFPPAHSLFVAEVEPPQSAVNRAGPAQPRALPLADRLILASGRRRDGEQLPSSS